MKPHTRQLLRPLPRPSRRGALLLLALWAVFMLSAAIMLWAGYVRHTLFVATSQQLDTEARAMAHSAVNLAMHPLVTRETDVLYQWESQNPGFQVQMISEGSKLNINFFFQGENPRRIEIFKRWLESRGIEFNDRERMVDCINDWLDADNIGRMSGQEDTAGYHPPNRGAFLEVEELAQVAGMEPLTSQPGWEDALTVDSQGPIDMKSAPFEILRLLPGLGDAGIARFIEWRQGDDQIDGTLDDPPIERLEDIRSFLGLNQVQFQELSGLIGINDPNWRIIADGWSGKIHRKVEVVANKRGQNPIIKRWKE